MNQIIKALFVVAVINILVYVVYSIAFVFYLPNFGMFGIMAMLLVMISFFSARGFYRLFDVSGIERIKSIVIVHTVILVLVSAFNIFLIPLLEETVNNVKEVHKYRQFKKGKAPIENGVWKYKKVGLMMPHNELSVPCKDGQIDGKVIFHHFDGEERFKVNYYSKGQLDSTTFWNGTHRGEMYLIETWIETDTFFYDLNYHLESVPEGMEIQKVGINEKGDTILNVKSPVITEHFDISNLK